jgi:4-diphosphocytidyl-2-C-methyl-D-erythritol kinase
VAGVPVDGTNLILRAAAGFAEATGWREAVKFTLEKRIPMGAGLGGGSSNAVAALRGMEALSGIALSETRRVELAAELGSDCPLFLRKGAVVMRGRGERVDDLSDAAASRLRGRAVLLFKPGFGVPTAAAYQALAARPEWYADAAAEEARLAKWMADEGAGAEGLFLNTLERPVFAKWRALPAMLEGLQGRHGLEARMSGSGSACFALVGGQVNVEAVLSTIRDGWGADAFVQITELA